MLPGDIEIGGGAEAGAKVTEGDGVWSAIDHHRLRQAGDVIAQSIAGSDEASPQLRNGDAPLIGQTIDLAGGTLQLGCNGSSARKNFVAHGHALSQTMLPRDSLLDN
jgi:hypothetical protein